MTRLAERIEAVEQRIGSACRRAGRARDAVTLVAVTKSIGPETARQAFELGLTHLAENRPQQLWARAAVLPPGVHWHMIGHLQRNKIERTLPLVEWIHGVDSARLLDALEEAAGARGQPVHVFLECNASGEASKQGFAPADLEPLLPRLAALRWVRVRGLMTMAAYDATPENCRPTFALLRQLRDRLRGQVTAPHDLEHLSMGMSNDFEVAIEEGATMVRLGTVLFEGIETEAS